MKITIVYDNEPSQEGLTTDWGFACIVEAYGKKILFDTGASGKILLENLKKLKIDVNSIDEIFISHNHWDHTGGLSELLAIKPFKVYIPPSCDIAEQSAKVIVDQPTCLHGNFYSTGQLQNVEQSLIIKTEKGLVIIVGCSHSGVQNILEAAEKFGKPIAIVGGLHDFNKLELLKDLTLVCSTHCTKHKKEIEKLYPQKYVAGGVGKIIKV